MIAGRFFHATWVAALHCRQAVHPGLARCGMQPQVNVLPLTTVCASSGVGTRTCCRERVFEASSGRSKRGGGRRGTKRSSWRSGWFSAKGGERIGCCHSKTQQPAACGKAVEGPLSAGDRCTRRRCQRSQVRYSVRGMASDACAWQTNRTSHPKHERLTHGSPWL
jgi:hypothetical protein